MRALIRGLGLAASLSIPRGYVGARPGLARPRPNLGGAVDVPEAGFGLRSA